MWASVWAWPDEPDVFKARMPGLPPQADTTHLLSTLTLRSLFYLPLLSFENKTFFFRYPKCTIAVYPEQ